MYTFVEIVNIFLKQTKSHLSYCLLFRVLLIFFFFLLLSCALFFTEIRHLIKPIVKKHSAILENNDRESKRFSRGNWLGLLEIFVAFSNNQFKELLYYFKLKSILQQSRFFYENTILYIMQHNIACRGALKKTTQLKYIHKLQIFLFQRKSPFFLSSFATHHYQMGKCSNFGQF